MFSLLSRRPRRATPAPAARLGLHSLDDRFVPAAPVISNFHASQIAAGVYQLTGTVTDADQSSTQGMTVTFGGGLQGFDGKTATVAADGTFAVTLTLSVIEAGCVTATTKDVDNNVSTEVWDTIDPVMPAGNGGGKGAGGGS